MKEIVIISGKGGTGKTSLASSFAVLAKKAVICDCDVDAPDLHLILHPQIIERHEFFSGHEAIIRSNDCTACGFCRTLCRFDAIKEETDRVHQVTYTVDPIKCEGCGVCVHFCPVRAIDFPERFCGHWFISRTHEGPMVHARLNAAAENSGKLVSIVRKEARRIAEEEKLDFIITDGPPGVGCPVIASITGCDLVFIVAEPTVSGEHDMERVISLAHHFKIRVAACVNKWDINPLMTERIEEKARASGVEIVGRIPYDEGFTEAQKKGKTVIEEKMPCARDVESLWHKLKQI
ncbi:MAG TPA: ATP-binding protein [Syntrophales bacterium]|nr:ATP-binding protein [Syntrophales bacterium]